MNIVHVPRRFARSEWGGTETVILETCKRLLKLGHNSEIICPNALAENNSETMEGVQITRAPYFYPYFGLGDDARRKLDKKGGNIFSFKLISLLMRHPGLSLIHLHTLKRIGGIGRHAARKRKVPYVVSLHGGVYDVPAAEAVSWTAPAKGAFEWGKILGWWVGSRLVLADAAAIICVGHKEKVEVQKRFPKKRVVNFPNGVDTKRFSLGDGKKFREDRGIPHNAKVVLSVGRIDPQKNQLFIIRLLPEMIKICPTLHAIFIGPITNDDYLRTLLDEIVNNRLSGRVTIIKGLDSCSREITDAYHAADIFLLPSVHEPFGIVILEAWSAGLPVIASNVGGVPSFVNNGKDGALTEPNNTNEFLNAFKNLVNNKMLSQNLAMAGRKKAFERFDWSTITKSLLSLYEEVISESSNRK